MNKIEKSLYRTRKTLGQVCKELGIDIEDVTICDIDTCSSCSIWEKMFSLKEDLDGNLICKYCYDTYGP